MNLKLSKIYIIGLFLYLGNFLSVVNAQCIFDRGVQGEECTTAEYICGSSLNGYVGRLRTANITQIFWNNPVNTAKTGVCGGAGQFDNTSWFSFTACSNNVHLRIHFSNCVQPNNNLNTTGIQTGLYVKCKKGNSVACKDSIGVTAGIIDLSYNGFIPGEIVYFVLDGYASSVCDFRVEVVSGLDLTPVTPPNPASLAEGFITGQNTIACSDKNKPFTYSLTEPERAVNFSTSCAPPNNFNPKDSICYSWSISPSTGSYFKDNKNTGTNTEIIFTEPGTYTISAETYFNPYYVGSCANAAAGKINSWTVTVLPPVTVSEPAEYVCPGTSIVYCGQTITKDTLIICDADPCRIVRKPFVFGTSKLNLLGTQYICQGGSFAFQGVNYTSPGSYSVQDNVDCALEHRFVVEVISLDASINVSNTILNCNRPSIALNGIIQSNISSGIVSQWKDANGNVVSNGATYVIDKPGRYKFEANYTSNGTTCLDSDVVSITSDFSKPEIQAFLPIVRCLLPKDNRPVITVISSDINAIATWTTPLGQKLNGLNVVADSINVSTGRPYLLSVIGSNGCKLDTSFIIQSNFEKAEINLQCDDLTCYKPSALMTVSVNMSFDSIRWNRIDPGSLAFYGSSIDQVNLLITQQGTYQVDVLASSSKCWNKKSLFVSDKKIDPTVNIDSNLPKWNCNTKSIEILPLASSGQQMEYLWSTSNGKILSKETEIKLEIGSPGTYSIAVLDKDNGCKKSATLQIVEETNKPSKINFNFHEPLCFGEPNGVVTINNTEGGFGPYTYFLNGQKLNELNLGQMKSGSYTLEVRDIHDCSFQSSFDILDPQLFTIQTDYNITLAFQENSLISFTSNYPDSEINEVRWLDGSGNLIGSDFDLDYTALSSDEISLEVITENGCISRAKVKITVDTELKVYFPNIFSPNGDGFNDRLEIFKNKIPANLDRVSIYDRLGNKVFDESNYDAGSNPEGWDGTFNQKPVVAGVYIMVVELTDYAGRKQVMKKDITVVR